MPARSRSTHGPAWTNDTTRSAGTALVMINGIWLNNAIYHQRPGGIARHLCRHDAQQCFVADSIGF